MPPGELAGVVRVTVEDPVPVVLPPAGVVYRWGGGYQQESYRPRSEKECYVTRLGKGPGLGAGYRFGNQPVITYGKVNCLGIIL